MAQGVVEVEGSEEFVRDLVAEFREQLAAQPISAARDKTRSQRGSRRNNARDSRGAETQRAEADEGTGSATPRSGRTRGRRQGGKQILSLDADLDLSTRGGKESLKSFFARYARA